MSVGLIRILRVRLTRCVGFRNGSGLLTGLVGIIRGIVLLSGRRLFVWLLVLMWIFIFRRLMRTYWMASVPWPSLTVMIWVVGILITIVDVYGGIFADRLASFPYRVSLRCFARNHLCLG